MEEAIRAIILGIVQGLTEFIPISSSGHLVLVPALFGWPDQGLAFDAGLHAGTLAAVLVYFFRDWLRMARAFFTDISGLHWRSATMGDDTRLLLLIVAGTVPAAVVGLLFDDWIEDNLREPWLVAIALVVAAGLMALAERQGTFQRKLTAVGATDAMVIGFAQALALWPGVSRSGATISAGLLRGFERGDAARFAFLLGTPAFAGAALLKMLDLGGEENVDTGDLLLGIVVAAVVGFSAIHFLLRFLRTRTLMPFVYYRLAVAALTLIIGGIRLI